MSQFGFFLWFLQLSGFFPSVFFGFLFYTYGYVPGSVFLYFFPLVFCGFLVSFLRFFWFIKFVYVNAKFVYVRMQTLYLYMCIHTYIQKFCIVVYIFYTYKNISFIVVVSV